jgi:hypothetical protein
MLRSSLRNIDLEGVRWEEMVAAVGGMAADEEAVAWEVATVAAVKVEEWMEEEMQAGEEKALAVQVVMMGAVEMVVVTRVKVAIPEAERVATMVGRVVPSVVVTRVEVAIPGARTEKATREEDEEGVEDTRAASTEAAKAAVEMGVVMVAVAAEAKVGSSAHTYPRCIGAPARRR